VKEEKKTGGGLQQRTSLPVFYHFFYPKYRKRVNYEKIHSHQKGNEERFEKMKI
jgi:hypothetical protein